MRVTSTLANLDMTVGTMQGVGDQLILKSGPGSSIDVEVSVSAVDVLRTLGAFLRSPSAWLFIVMLPVHWIGGRRAPSAVTARRYPGYELNNPWLS